MYPPCTKLGTMLKKFGAAICSLVLLGSSPTIETYMKEAQYYYLKYICNYLQNMIW
jgi:hypothetical protein